MLPLLVVYIVVSASCTDDPLGYLWHTGTTCAELTLNGTARCWEGLEVAGGVMPSGWLVADVCKASCGNCGWWEPWMRCSDDAICVEAMKSHQCEDLLAQQNTTVNAMCKSSCNNCPVAPTLREHQCIDDPYGFLPLANTTCQAVTAQYGCGAYSATLDPVWTICRGTCGTCQPTDLSFCRDSDLRLYGLDCTVLPVVAGCKYDLHYSNMTQFKPGSLVDQYCRRSCQTCPEHKGNSTKCRPFLTNPYYHHATGTTDTSMWNWMGGYIKGGFHGEPGSCSEIARDAPYGARFCSVYDALFICVPEECHSNDLKDFFRELTLGYHYGNITAVCEGEGEPWGWVGVSAVVFTFLLAALIVLSTALNRGYWRIASSMTALTAARDSPTSFLDCMRTISVLWIVLGHSYFFYSISPGFSNPAHELDELSKIPSAPIASTEFAVDTFFYMSGLLGTIMYLNQKTLKKRVPVVKTAGVSAVLRYFRIVPLMAYTMLVGITVLPHLGSGPKWFTFSKNLNLKPTSDVCEKYWWRNVLLISNFFKWPDEMCFGWLWYLPVDFQLSSILPFLLLPYTHPRATNLTKLLNVISLILLILLNMVLGYTEHLSRRDSSYVKPYLRMAPYLYGVLTSIVLENFADKEGGWSWVPLWSKQRPQIEVPLTDETGEGNHVKGSWVRVACYVSSAGLLLTAVYLLFKRESSDEKDNPWSKRMYDLFNVYYLFSWGLGLGLFTVPFALGHGGIIRRAMSHRVWSPLAKLSYGVYLVHPLVIYFSTASTSGPIHYSAATILWNWAAASTLSYFVSLALWFLVECPFSFLLSAAKARLLLKPPQANQTPDNVSLPRSEDAYEIELELIPLELTSAELAE
eukprot:TRINITY_DN9863_c0_g1_i1.p1 TRINITY_DN9863_c0_g1~~TRINITY_DN9863_c0_g1_i1.p1  ORF type:complete len:859 (+),score=163.14 TRINITY_DN9863_c0_g1_i1:235-2811(+)